MTLALKNTETEPVPTHRGAHPEIAPSATRSAPAAEPNEADLLPALDSGREKLLSSTEVESTLKDWPTQEQASLKEQMARSNPCPHPTKGSVERAIRCSAAASSTYAGVCVRHEDGNPLVRRRGGHGPAAHALANGCRPRVAL